MKGTLYCIGVGPGDPELMTLKGLRRIRQCPVLAVPEGKPGVMTAKQILLEAVKKIDYAALDGKDVLTIRFPMVLDKEVVQKAHAEGARAVESKLEQGLDVALITLGCPTVYASSMYIHRIVKEDGYATEIIAGVPSFCASAARLQQSLCEKDEVLTIIPAGQAERKKWLALPGRKIIMKPAGSLAGLKEDLASVGKLDKTMMVERCGLAGERTYETMDGVDEAPYFSVLLVRE